MKKLWTAIKNLLVDPLVENVGLREEWYRNEIIQAYEDRDIKRAVRLEGERDRCYGHLYLP